MKIALVQHEIIHAQISCNAEKIIAEIKRAAAVGADIIIFPELALTGSLLGDIWDDEAFLRDAESFGKDIIKLTDEIEVTVIFGNVAVDWTKENSPGQVRKYNALFIAQKGALIAPPSSPYPYLIKASPNQAHISEQRYFYPAQLLAVELGISYDDFFKPLTINIKNAAYTIAPLFLAPTTNIALLIDERNRDRYRNTDYFISVTSLPFTLTSEENLTKLFAAVAKAHKHPLIHVNSLGLQNTGKTFYTYAGNSAYFAADGRQSLKLPAYKEAVRIIDTDTPPSSPAQPSLKESAAIYAALRYGISRFLREAKLDRIVIGVSGGIDSAVAAALYTDILGSDNVLLVNMPSRFNSATTKDLASELARNLGCPYMIAPIEDSVEYTVRTLQEIPITHPTGKISHLNISPFVTENIQARDRGSRVLAGIAAAWGAVFTCNANKTESTIGYATLYGDSSGALAAQADLWKYQVYNLARYLNEAVYKTAVIPQGIIDIVPSAELSEAQNVDEGKGDPVKYPYHDYLFRALMENNSRVTLETILEWYADGTLEKNIGCQTGLVAEYFSTAADFIADLERWWSLYHGMAVVKRVQSPPIIAVTDKPYGSGHAEAQNTIYYTRRYEKLKAGLLA